MTENHKLTDLLERLAAPRDEDDLADTLIAEILENDGSLNLPSRASDQDPDTGHDDQAVPINAVVEIGLYGVVAHGRTVGQACVSWLDAARRQVGQTNADPS